jgi:nitric oxide reductase NorD protein
MPRLFSRVRLIASRLSSLVPRRTDESRDRRKALARLALADIHTFRLWSARLSAVDEVLGRQVGLRCTSLLAELSEAHHGTARDLAGVLSESLSRVQPQQRQKLLSVLVWAQGKSPSSLPMLAAELPSLLLRFEGEGLDRFLSEALVLHSESPARALGFLRLESREAVDSAGEAHGRTALEGLRRSLALYARGHCGEDVHVLPGERAYTDGRDIFLPRSLDLAGEAAVLAYRVLTARCAGYLEYGTFDLCLSDIPGDWPAPRPEELELERLFRSFGNPSLAKDLFFVFETYRVESLTRVHYPGMARDMDHLGNIWSPPREVASRMSPAVLAVETLRRHARGDRALDGLEPAVATAAAAAVQYFAAGGEALGSVCALQESYPAFHALLSFVQPGGRGVGAEGYAPSAGGADRPSVELAGQESRYRRMERLAQELREELRGKGEEVSIRQARRRAGSSYEEMDAFLERMPGPSGPLRRDGRVEPGDSTLRNPGLAESCTPSKGSWSYPEWDLEIGDIKPSWTQLREFRLSGGSSDFSDQVLAERGGEIRRLRAAFSALRPEVSRPVRGMDDGCELDIGRVIEAKIDRRAGFSSPSGLYVRRLRQERNAAVAFLLDLSSSTNEVANPEGRRIIDVEKEALLVISEAVDAIGDDFAIYGFSGYGRDQVAFYLAKDFDEPWGEPARRRVGKMSWKMENRDGAAIRHCTRKLVSWPSRSRLLVLLSDGKPLDCGCSQYSDAYAQADTKAALQEARQLGVRAFCITVDPYGQDYLQSMYGKHGYTVIDRVDTLPQRLPRIYRRLTR